MRLALCDDHTLFTQALATTLEARGHSVAACLDPAELPALLAGHRPDLVVLDARFGGVDRYDLPHLVRASTPRAAVVMLTSMATTQAWAAYAQGTVDALVAKTCELDALERTFTRVRSGQRLVSGFVPPQDRRAGRLGAAGRSGGADRPGGDRRSFLTAREHEVLRLVAQGLSTEEMAGVLDLSVHTVRSHVRHVLTKLDAHHRGAAVVNAVARGWLPAPTTKRTAG